MVGNLLLRGMLVGVLAGLLSFAFLKLYGEPEIDRAIASESQLDAAKAKAAPQEATGLPAPPADEEPELVSRKVQASWGLFTGVMVYNAAFGGLFSLAFAFVYGRKSSMSARATSAMLAVAGLIAIYIVPNLKYPANPPSVGNPATIGARTALYFGMITISIVAMIAAVKLRTLVRERLGDWNGSIAAGVAWLIVIALVALALPVVDEVPAAFPAVVLWKFRMASLGSQIIMWATLGLGFGAVAEAALGAFIAKRPPARGGGPLAH